MKTKICIKCKQVKPLSEYYKSTNTKDGFRGVCKECCLALQKQRRNTPEGKAAMKRYDSGDKGKNRRLKYRYGLTIKQHKEMYIKQNGCCYLCDEPIPYDDIHTDHNHFTKKVRKLLCLRCNVFAGKIEKNPELTILIMKYLDEHKLGDGI